jgi:hypothetical protein
VIDLKGAGAQDTARTDILRGAVQQASLRKARSAAASRDQIIETRQALVTQLPVTGELLRGSLFERTVRHTSGCTICAGGGGHPLWVLTISYAGGRTRQFSLRREQVDEVRRWLGNYHKLKEALEDICELNHALLRPDGAAPRRARKDR